MFFPDAVAMLHSIHASGATGQVHLGAGRLRRALRAYDHAFRTPRGVQANWTWLAIQAQPQTEGNSSQQLQLAKHDIEVRSAEPGDFFAKSLQLDTSQAAK